MALDVVVENPMGSWNKYEMDQECGRIRLDRTLFTATQYPADYGYIPDTLSEDKEPLDALVVVAQPTFPGCVISSRVIAAFWMRDEQGPDAKLLCVPSDDPRQSRVRDMPNMPECLVAEIARAPGILSRGSAAETALDYGDR